MGGEDNNTMYLELIAIRMIQLKQLHVHESKSTTM